MAMKLKLVTCRSPENLPALADENGIILPAQEHVVVDHKPGGRSTVTVTFAIADCDSCVRPALHEEGKL